MDAWGQLKKHSDFKAKFEGKFQKLLEQMEAEFAQDQPEAVKTPSRHIPVAIARPVVQFTGGLCAFPGCAKPYEILHHTQRFVLEKVHHPDP